MLVLEQADHDRGDHRCVQERTHGGPGPGADLVEAETGLVELVVALDLPADTVEVGDRARRDSRRKAGEEEGVALVGRHADQAAAHFASPVPHPHVRVDDLPVESQDLEVEEEIEVESRKENSAHRASGDVVHLGLPVFLQPDDVLDAVAFAGLEQVEACVAEVGKQPQTPPALVHFQVRGVVFTRGREVVGDGGADSHREALVDLERA
jgi:hypothetical protein